MGFLQFYQGLLQVFGFLAQIGFSLTLVTNGTRLTAEQVERLKALPINISLSLDTLDRERYRGIRGADQLPFVLNGVNQLADFLDQRLSRDVEKSRLSQAMQLDLSLAPGGLCLSVDYQAAGHLFRHL